MTYRTSNKYHRKNHDLPVEAFYIGACWFLLMWLLLRQSAELKACPRPWNISKVCTPWSSSSVPEAWREGSEFWIWIGALILLGPPNVNPTDKRRKTTDSNYGQIKAKLFIYISELNQWLSPPKVGFMRPAFSQVPMFLLYGKTMRFLQAWLQKWSKAVRKVSLWTMGQWVQKFPRRDGPEGLVYSWVLSQSPGKGNSYFVVNKNPT